MKCKAVLFPVLLCLAATVPPLPPVPKRNHKSAAVSQGDAAARLIAKIAPPAAPHTNTFVWSYPPQINPSNFFWNIETAVSASGPWTVLITNASGAQDVTVTKSEGLRLFRLSRNLSP